DRPRPGTGPVLLEPTPGVGKKVATSSPKLLEAVQRDMRLSRAQAITRLGRQDAAGAVESRARRAAGRSFAGAWLNGDGSSLMVAVTDQRVAPAVRAAGGNPKLVAHRRGELEIARLKLRAHNDKTSGKTSGKATGTVVRGWHIDLARNRVVVQAAPGKQAAAARWVAAAGVPAGLVAYDTGQAPLKAAADVRGGDSFTNSFSKRKCTAGFTVKPLLNVDVLGTDGFITAGHCVDKGNFVDLDDSLIPGVGRTNQSPFPLPGTPPVNSQTQLRDRAFVQFNPGLGTQALPTARSGLFTTIPIVGSQAAGVGSVVCSYGRSSGYRCGPLLSTFQDVIVDLRDDIDNRGSPTILDVHTARFCSSPGDSGGPVITPEGQAQGTVVGSNCTGVGLTSVYQPINRSMNDLQVRLKLAGARPPTPGPVITSFNCYSDGDDENALFTCELYWTGGTDPKQVQVSSNGRWLRKIDNSDYNYYVFAGNCAPFGSTYARVTVVDDDGRRDEDSNPSVCNLS
ncbi:S1 family peptidase, partial [Actinomadura soli]